MKRRKKLAMGIVTAIFGVLFSARAFAAQEYYEGSSDNISISQEACNYNGKFSRQEGDSDIDYVDWDKLTLDIRQPGVLCVQIVVDDLKYSYEDYAKVYFTQANSSADYFMCNYLGGGRANDYHYTDYWTMSDHTYARFDMFVDPGVYYLIAESKVESDYHYRMQFYPYRTTLPVSANFGVGRGYEAGLGETVYGAVNPVRFGYSYSYMYEWKREKAYDPAAQNDAWNMERNIIHFNAPSSGEYKINLNANNVLTVELDGKDIDLDVNPHKDFTDAGPQWDRWNVNGIEYSRLSKFETAAKTVYLTPGDHTLVVRRDVFDAFLPFIPACYNLKVEKAALREQSINVATSFKKTTGSAAFSLNASAQGKLSYSSDNTKVAKVSGTGKVTIKGAGTAHITVKAAGTEIYKEGQKKVTITVSKRTQKINTKSSYSKVVGDRAFTLKPGVKGGAAVKYSSSNKKVAVVSKKGKVTLKGAGKATITVSAAATKSYKSATKKIKITVKPKTPTNLKLTRPGKGKIKVSWKKVSGVKYQIQYTDYSTGYNTGKPNYNMGKILSNVKPNKLMKNLYSGSTYYVRVRSYCGSGSNRVYSSWSKTRSIKTK